MERGSAHILSKRIEQDSDVTKSETHAFVICETLAANENKGKELETRVSKSASKIYLMEKKVHNPVCLYPVICLTSSFSNLTTL